MERISELSEETVKAIYDAHLHPASIQAENNGVAPKWASWLGETAVQRELFTAKAIVRPVWKLIDDLLGGGKIDLPERVILEILVERWRDKPITQRNIARTSPWLGCHPTHEADIAINKFETTTRKVRAVVRSLRINHRLPILSSIKGYWLPTEEAEVRAYLARTEKQAQAASNACLETYYAMRDTLGVTSEVLERLFQFTAQTK